MLLIDKQKLFDAKLKLYSLLLHCVTSDLTDNEIDLMIYLSKDDQIQKHFNQKTHSIVARGAFDTLNSHLTEKARGKGYVPGVWIISEAFPHKKLNIGYGMIWSEQQNCLVVGCTNTDKEYYTAVPIYNSMTGKWAEIVNK